MMIDLPRDQASVTKRGKGRAFSMAVVLKPPAANALYWNSRMDEPQPVIAHFWATKI
jgi:hypothetical protein